VRNVVEAPACAGVQNALRPVTTSICSRNGASGNRMGVVSNAAPSVFGVQKSIAIPFGT
jgi:hypothetical protein